MARFDAALAKTLDFDAPSTPTPSVPQARTTFALAGPQGAGLRGPNKYKVLDLRRRHAQIQARRLLDLLD